MSDANLLLLFPSIVVPIFSDWIHDLDLGCLDSAVCNVALRQCFLFIITKCKIANIDVEHYDSYLNKCDWIARRGLQVKMFHVKKRLTATEMVILSNTKTLDQLKGWTGTYLFEALDLCPNVIALKLHLEFSQIDLLLARIQNVKKLDVSGCSGLLTLFKTFFASLHHDLQGLRAPVSYNTASLIRENKDLTEIDAFINTEVVDAIAQSSSITCVFLNGVQWGTQMLDEGLIRIVNNCPNLRQFTLLHNILTDESIVHMAERCNHLTCFEAGLSSSITDASLMALACHCRSLSKIAISSSNVTDPGVTMLATYCKNLSNVSLKWCTNVTEHSIREVLLRCKRLVFLDISYTRFTKKIAQEAFQLCPSLGALIIMNEKTCMFDSKVIKNMECISLFGLKVEMKRLRREAEVLSIQWNQTISYGLKTQDFCNIFYYNSHLLELTLSNQLYLFDDDFEVLVAACCCITSISIIRCSKLSDRALMFLETSCLPLKAIHFVDLKGATDDDMIDLMKAKCQTVKKLWLSECKSLSDKLLNCIAAHCHSMESLSLTRMGSALTTQGLCRIIYDCRKLCYLEMDSKHATSPDMLQAVADIGRPHVVDIAYNFCSIRWFQ